MRQTDDMLPPASASPESICPIRKLSDQAKRVTSQHDVRSDVEDISTSSLRLCYTIPGRYVDASNAKECHDELASRFQSLALAEALPISQDERALEDSIIFYQQWKRAEANTEYAKLKREWKAQYG